jgi:hypothetical protein
MGPHGRPSMSRAKNFKQSILNLLKYSKRQITLIVIAIILVIGSTICTLIGPDKLKDLTNIIYPLGVNTASTLTLDDLYTETNKETGVVTQPVYTSIVPTFVHDLDEKGNNAEYTEGEMEGEYIFVPSELYRTINITVKPELASVEKAFTIREKDGILKEFEKSSNYLTLNSFDIAFTPCKIAAGFNAVNDQMIYATFDKNMVITANVTFKGALAEYGTVIVEFPCTSQITYNFGWESTAE